MAAFITRKDDPAGNIAVPGEVLHVAGFAPRGVGVGVKAGASKPTISTVDAFKAAVLKAKSVSYLPSPGVPQLLDRLGIAEAVKPKATIPNTDIVSELVAKGEVEMVIVVVTQILTTPGVELVFWAIAARNQDHDVVRRRGERELRQPRRRARAAEISTQRGGDQGDPLAGNDAGVVALKDCPLRQSRFACAPLHKMNAGRGAKLLHGAAGSASGACTPRNGEWAQVNSVLEYRKEVDARSR